MKGNGSSVKTPPVRTMYDAAFPTSPPRGATVAGIYFGGAAYHTWSPDEIRAAPVRYRLPIWVAVVDKPLTGALARIDASEAIRRLRALGVPARHWPPNRVAVALDIEMSVAPEYVAAFAGA